MQCGLPVVAAWTAQPLWRGRKEAENKWGLGWETICLVHFKLNMTVWLINYYVSDHFVQNPVHLKYKHVHKEPTKCSQQTYFKSNKFLYLAASFLLQRIYGSNVGTPTFKKRFCEDWKTIRQYLFSAICKWHKQDSVNKWKKEQLDNSAYSTKKVLWQ